MVLQLAQQACAHGAVGNCIGLFGVLEQEGEVKHHELFVQAGQQTGGHRREVQRAAAHGRQVLGVTAQHGVGEQADLHLAAAFFCDQIGKLLCALAEWVVLGQAERKLQVAVLDVLDVLDVLGLGGAQGQQQAGEGEGTTGEVAAQQVCLHWVPFW